MNLSAQDGSHIDELHKMSQCCDICWKYSNENTCGTCYLHLLFSGIMANPSNLKVMAESSRICYTYASAINSSSYYVCKESDRKLCVFPSF